MLYCDIKYKQVTTAERNSRSATGHYRFTWKV